MIEKKSLFTTNIKAESTGRVRTGIAAVFGNVDAVGDRIMPGAFTRQLNSKTGWNRVKHLWNHKHERFPVAHILDLREISKKDLPDAVLEQAPDATGGLLVKREYFKHNKDSDILLEAIDAGAINEMSFAFDVARSAEAKHKNEDGEERTIRELLELTLFDTSDVNWGANAATSADGTKDLDIELDDELVTPWVLANQLGRLVSEFKSGRRDPRFDRDLLDFIYKTATELGAVYNPNENPPAPSEPEPAVISDSTSLLLKQNRAKVNDLKLYLSKL